jgi:hypothetical protein
MAMAYYEENGSYFDDAYITSVLGLPNDCSGTQYYFSYTIDGGANSGTVFANRCGAGTGKPPGCAAPACPAGGYYLSLTQAGAGASDQSMW